MRFLADENVSQVVILRLRAHGHDVASVRERSAGASDREVLEDAQITGNILITEDRDFGELVIRQRLKVSGVILLELDKLSNATEADLVMKVISDRADKLAGNLTVIEPARIRARPLAP